MLRNIEIAIREKWYRMKGRLLRFYLIMHGCKAGKNLVCKKWPVFRNIPKRNIEIGDDVIIGYYITLGVNQNGMIRIGNGTELTHNVLVSSGSEVNIGAHVLIAENVTIRDDNHQTAMGELISRQPWTYLPVQIGNDVWIGAGCMVLMQAQVAEGAVIGANSVVLGKSEIAPYGIYAGSPVRKIGQRK